MFKQALHQYPTPKSPRNPMIAATFCALVALAFWLALLPNGDTKDWSEKMWIIHWANHQAELKARDFFMVLSLLLFAVAVYRILRNRKRKVAP